MNNENRCPQCVLENNNGICDRKNCSNYKKELTDTLGEEINVYNTLFIVKTLLNKNGVEQNLANNIVDMLRPVFISLDRHKELVAKASFDDGFNKASQQK